MTEAGAADAVIAGLLGKPKRKYTKKAAASAPVDAASHPLFGKTKRKKGKMSPEGRAAIVAAQKARWAKAKAQKN